jgi:hypothetical protein
MAVLSHLATHVLTVDPECTHGSRCFMDLQVFDECLSCVTHAGLCFLLAPAYLLYNVAPRSLFPYYPHFVNLSFTQLYDVFITIRYQPADHINLYYIHLFQYNHQIPLFQAFTQDVLPSR